MFVKFYSVGFLALFLASFSSTSLAEEGAIYTNRKPPLVKEKTPPSKPDLYPVKDCVAEVDKKVQEQTARYGSPPGEEGLNFFRKECDDDAAQFKKMNADNEAFYNKQMADFEADQEKERQHAKEHQTLFYAEEKAAKSVADSILKIPGVSFDKNAIADIRLLKDNAHILKGKTFITEARLIERTTETRALFETAGYTTVQVKDIPSSQILTGAEYVVLVGTISGMETYHDKTLNKPFDLPTIEWKTSPTCRVSLPDGLESHTAQCLPMAVIRKQLDLP